MNVKLRRRLRGKKVILYLEINYMGERKFEYLKQYLHPVPEKGSLTKEQKQFNKEMEAFAGSLRSEMELDLHRGKLEFADVKRTKINFLDYFDIVCQRRTTMSEGNLGNWLSVKKHLVGFIPDGISIKEIDRQWLENFKTYLNTEARTKGNQPLSQNTRCSYYRKITATLKEALKEKIITDNPSDYVASIEPGENEREYLTKDDIKVLLKTKCEIPILKEAFLFSCFTGLRWSDVQKLTWREVRYSSEIGNHLVFRQKKTGGAENLPIAENAMRFVGERRDDGDLVFKGLKYSAWHNLRLQQWVLLAGINKKITFHCSRHTNAFLLLDSNIDIYTVSKMLGHKHLKTTEIYSHINDKRKMAAANSINFNLI